MIKRIVLGVIFFMTFLSFFLFLVFMFMMNNNPQAVKVFKIKPPIQNTLLESQFFSDTSLKTISINVSGDKLISIIANIDDLKEWLGNTKYQSILVKNRGSETNLLGNESYANLTKLSDMWLDYKTSPKDINFQWNTDTMPNTALLVGTQHDGSEYQINLSWKDNSYIARTDLFRGLSVLFAILSFIVLTLLLIFNRDVKCKKHSELETKVTIWLKVKNLLQNMLGVSEGLKSSKKSSIHKKRGK